MNVRLWWLSMVCVAVVCIDPCAAVIGASLAQSMSTLNQQLSKFVEGLQHNVDEWADKAIDNANHEECFYLCAKGVTPVPRVTNSSESSAEANSGCSTFGMHIADTDLPAEEMKQCCDGQQQCYHRCNANKVQCDTDFQRCLRDQCFVITANKEPKQFAACSAATKLFLMGMLSFGCKTFKDAQQQACVCSDS